MPDLDVLGAIELELADVSRALERLDEGTYGTCEACGAARVFEVQMTPNAIAEMERDETGFDGMAWGTIIVGVCEKDCGGGGEEDERAGYREEWVGVQWEENVARR